MTPELDKQLCEKYPLIFADRNANMSQTAMCWGFECADGWYNIIDTLCKAIQNHIDQCNVSQVVAVQVKEKFGGLRFYYDGGDDYIEGLVQMAEMISERTCEVCGNKSTLYQTGWHKILCIKCGQLK